MNNNTINTNNNIKGEMNMNTTTNNLEGLNTEIKGEMNMENTNTTTDNNFKGDDNMKMVNNNKMVEEVKTNNKSLYYSLNKNVDFLLAVKARKFVTAAQLIEIDSNEVPELVVQESMSPKPEVACIGYIGSFLDAYVPYLSSIEGRIAITSNAQAIITARQVLKMFEKGIDNESVKAILFEQKQKAFYKTAEEYLDKAMNTAIKYGFDDEQLAEVGEREYPDDFAILGYFIDQLEILHNSNASVVMIEEDKIHGVKGKTIGETGAEGIYIKLKNGIGESNNVSFEADMKINMPVLVVDDFAYFMDNKHRRDLLLQANKVCDNALPVTIKDKLTEDKVKNISAVLEARMTANA